jgi:hypothetical protein
MENMRKPVSLRSLAMCAVVMVAGLTGLCRAQKVGGPILLVANQGDRDLSLIDPAAGKQVATVPVEGVTGHEVAASPDGSTAYVPIYGDSGVGKPGTDGSEIAVIDIASRKLIHKIDFGHGVRPHCAIYDRNSGMLYVTTELDKSISIIDPRSLKIVGSVPTGQEQSHMLALSRDGSRGYTANVGPGTVSVLDMKARKTVTIIPISKETRGDRYRDEHGEDLGAASRGGLWDGFNAGWPMAAGCAANVEAGSSRRSEDHEGRADD